MTDELTDAELAELALEAATGAWSDDVCDLVGSLVAALRSERTQQQTLESELRDLRHELAIAWGPE